MDLGFLKQLGNKKSLWIDIGFYFMVSLLVSTIFCYFIFGAKIFLQTEAIKQLDLKMLDIGTAEQKNYEKIVFNYQAKINDFGKLINAHKFPSNAFIFLEKNVLPEVWLSNFSMSGKASEININGEAESMVVLSRQVLVFENNEFVKKVDLSNLTIGDKNRIKFSLSISLDTKIFETSQLEPINNTAEVPANNILP
jgi:Tfp pilus assembly protein PilN